MIRIMEPKMFIKADVKELELSDVVKIHYRPFGNDIGEIVPIVGFVSRKYNGNGKLYLKSTDPRYKPGRWGEKGYNINDIEYVKKLSPFGKKSNERGVIF